MWQFLLVQFKYFHFTDEENTQWWLVCLLLHIYSIADLESNPSLFDSEVREYIFRCLCCQTKRNLLSYPLLPNRCLEKRLVLWLIPCVYEAVCGAKHLLALPKFVSLNILEREVRYLKVSRKIEILF